MAFKIKSPECLQFGASFIKIAKFVCSVSTISSCLWFGEIFSQGGWNFDVSNLDNIIFFFFMSMALLVIPVALSIASESDVYQA